MDCQMPKLDGWAATERIRSRGQAPLTSASQRCTSSCPIIALTAAALPEERNRCCNAGMDAFLAKPLKLAELQETLKPYARRVG